MSVPKIVATSVESAATRRLSFIDSYERLVGERIAPGVERERLPDEVELAGRLVEAVQDDHEDRQEQVQQHQPGVRRRAASRPSRAASGQVLGAEHAGVDQHAER